MTEHQHTPEEQARNRGLVVAALRSGGFTQGRDELQYVTGGRSKYCCLGVACRVAERHGVAVRTHASGTLRGISLADQPAVRDWLGIGDFGAYAAKRSLAVDNDHHGHTFSKIADTIERVWDVA